MFSDPTIYNKLKNNFCHIDILNQGFKKYSDYAFVILTWLSVGEIFDALDAGVIMIAPGDFPAQNYERIIIEAGCIESPSYLARLLRLASEESFQKIFLRVNAMNQNLPEDGIIEKSGNAALNIWT